MDGHVPSVQRPNCKSGKENRVEFAFQPLQQGHQVASNHRNCTREDGLLPDSSHHEVTSRDVASDGLHANFYNRSEPTCNRSSPRLSAISDRSNSTCVGPSLFTEYTAWEHHIVDSMEEARIRMKKRWNELMEARRKSSELEKEETKSRQGADVAKPCAFETSHETDAFKRDEMLQSCPHSFPGLAGEEGQSLTCSACLWESGKVAFWECAQEGCFICS